MKYQPRHCLVTSGYYSGIEYLCSEPDYSGHDDRRDRLAIEAQVRVVRAVCGYFSLRECGAGGGMAALAITTG